MNKQILEHFRIVSAVSNFFEFGYIRKVRQALLLRCAHSLRDRHCVHSKFESQFETLKLKIEVGALASARNPGSEIASAPNPVDRLQANSTLFTDPVAGTRVWQ